MQKWQREAWEWLKALALAVVLALLLRAFVVDNYIVDGSSMLPTLHDQERVLVYKLGRRLGDEPERGDIVVFRYAREPWRDFVKRVIGVAGDEVQISGGRVYVNGQPLDEPYLTVATLGEYGPQTVEPGTVFVLGDNRNFSKDSRDASVGLVSLDAIRGNAWLVYWPPKGWRLLGR
ncbi:MAG: signal peptidase I [Bacillota bacterium]|jgi:signal peptidase I